MSDSSLFGANCDPTERNRILVLGSLAAVAVGLLGSLRPVTLSGDARRYLLMVANPSTFQDPPWGYRIGVPALAHLLPMDPRVSLAIVNLASLVVATVLLAFFIRLEFDLHRTTLAIGLFLTSEAVNGSLNEYLVDVPAIAIILGCILVARRERWLWLIPLMAAGVAVKESTVMVLFPLTIMAFHGPERRRQLLSVGAAAACALAVFALLRWTDLVFPSSVRTQASPMSVKDVLDYQTRHQGSVMRSALNAVYSQGIVLLLPAVVGLRRISGWASALLSLLIPIVGTLAMATDWPRLLGFSVLFLIPLVCSLGTFSWIDVGLLTAVAAFEDSALPFIHGPLKVTLLMVCVLVALFVTLNVSLLRARRLTPTPISGTQGR